MNEKFGMETLQIGDTVRLGRTTSRSIGLQDRIVTVKALEGGFAIVGDFADKLNLNHQWEIRLDEWDGYTRPSKEYLVAVNPTEVWADDIETAG